MFLYNPIKSKINIKYIKPKIKSIFLTPPLANKTPGHLSIVEGLSLQEIVSDLESGSVIVEIGSFLGRSSGFIVEAMPAETKLYCIDTWENDAMPEGKQDTFNEFMKNMCLYDKNRYQAIRGKSNNISKSWVEPISFLWIDGDHSYDGCLEDLKNWFPFLKPGSWIALHDYLNPCGVKEAAHNYLIGKIDLYYFVESIFYGRKI